MKMNKIKTPKKVLFLLFLIYFAHIVETSNSIKNSLNALVHSNKLYRSKYSNTKVFYKSKIMRRNISKAKFFEFIANFFHSLKEKFTGEKKNDEDANLSLKQKAENFVLKIIWEQGLKRANDFEKLVQKISFIVNNPITSLLFKIHKMLFKDNSDDNYAKVDKRKIIDEKKDEKKKEPEDKNSKGWFKNLIDKARLKAVEFLEKTTIEAIENFIASEFEDVYIGFFKGMLVQFSPIASINYQDSQTLGHIQDYVTVHISNNKVTDSELVLTKLVNDFIDSTTQACKDYSNMKDLSKNFINKIMKFLSSNFHWFKNLIASLNNLVEKAKGKKDSNSEKKKEEDVDDKKNEKNKKDEENISNHKLNMEEINKLSDEDRDNLIEKLVLSKLEQMKRMAKEVWEFLEEEFILFFTAMIRCMSIYNENFVKFFPKALSTLEISLIGGIIDGFVKQIPLVSQIIGIINSLIGVYNVWRMFSFGEVKKEIADSTKLNANSLGVSLANFVSSKFRAALGLLNISGIENALKVAHIFYAITKDYLLKKEEPDHLKIEKTKMNSRLLKKESQIREYKYILPIDFSQISLNSSTFQNTYLKYNQYIESSFSNKKH